MNEARKRLVFKVLIAVLASWLSVFSLSAVALNLNLVSFSANRPNPLIPFLVVGGSFVAFALVGLVNGKSIWAGIVAGCVGLLSLPIAYLYVGPATEKVLRSAMPNSSLMSSGSFTFIWFSLTPILFIELFTDRVTKSGRWKHLILGVLISLSVVVGIEWLTAGQPIPTDSSQIVVYAALIWGVVVLSTNSKPD